MADVCGNAGRATDIVEAEKSDEGVALEQKRERLANTSASAEDGDLGVASGGRREAAGAGEGAEGGAGQKGRHRGDGGGGDGGCGGSIPRRERRTRDATGTRL